MNFVMSVARCDIDIEFTLLRNHPPLSVSLGEHIEKSFCFLFKFGHTLKTKHVLCMKLTFSVIAFVGF